MIEWHRRWNKILFWHYVYANIHKNHLKESLQIGFDSVVDFGRIWFATAVEWNLYASVNLCVTDWIFLAGILLFRRKESNQIQPQYMYENRINGTTIPKPSAFWCATKLGEHFGGGGSDTQKMALNW